VWQLLARLNSVVIPGLRAGTCCAVMRGRLLIVWYLPTIEVCRYRKCASADSLQSADNPQPQTVRIRNVSFVIRPWISAEFKTTAIRTALPTTHTAWCHVASLPLYSPDPIDGSAPTHTAQHQHPYNVAYRASDDHDDSTISQ